MTKIFKFMLEHKKALLVVFLLLITQAVCDLALPSYTSNIVDVGISKSGIQSAVPEIISEQQYQMLDAFLFDESKTNFENHYNLVKYDEISQTEQSRIDRNYPGIKERVFYEFTGDKAIREQLEVPIAKANLIITGMMKEGTDLTSILSAPEGKRKEMLQPVEDKMTEI